MPDVTPTQRFLKAIRKLPPDRQQAAMDSLAKFIATPHLPRLDFRPLRSRQEHYLINGKRGDRIILQKETEDHYLAIDVGPHDNILRHWNR